MKVLRKDNKGGFMKKFTKSYVCSKDISYTSKKDGKEKIFTQYYIVIETKNGNNVACKINLDYNIIKNINTHIGYNGIEFINID